MKEKPEHPGGCPNEETGEAQEAPAKRDAAYDTFGEWMDEFYATAEIALRKTPQMMEKLGLVQG